MVGRTGTTAHHPYWIYKLDCISPIWCIACTHGNACQRPRRGPRRACAAPPGPSATSHHPLPSPGPLGAASESPGPRNGRNIQRHSALRTGDTERPCGRNATRDPSTAASSGAHSGAVRAWSGRRPAGASPRTSSTPRAPMIMMRGATARAAARKFGTVSADSSQQTVETAPRRISPRPRVADGRKAYTWRTH